MLEPVIVFGQGAQTKYILENFALTGQYKGRAVLTKNTAVLTLQNIYKVPVVEWNETSIEGLKDEGICHAIVVHSNNREKASLMRSVKEMGFELVNAIHPHSTIATTACIGCNVVINANAVIQPFARIGNGVMVHAGVIVEHDNIIEDFVNLAPGATSGT